MSQTAAVIRKRIQAQGFCDLNDAMYSQINFPLRLAPALCMLWAAIGTSLASPTILWSLAPFAAFGAILPGHPFDIFYNYGLRHLFGMPALPRYGVRRRFACVSATIMIATSAWGFQTGRLILGEIAGWWFVAAALVNVSTGFCIPGFIARMLFGETKCSESSDRNAARIPQ
jgi:Domain of unknown function (DUF4395)